MNKNFKLLDCTLRDGSLVNGGNFGEVMIRETISNLVKSNTEIVEIGFLDDVKYNPNINKFNNISDIKKLLPENKSNAKYSVMALGINLDHIEENDGTIDIIRIALKRSQIDNGIETIKKLQDKGYKCSINPVNLNVYSENEYVDLIKKVNDLKPYAFSMVDTFGVLLPDELSKIYKIVEEFLDKEVAVGLHLHENLGISYNLAQQFLDISNNSREIILDSSICGFGREPGNLRTEQIMEFANLKYKKEYNINLIYDLIDNHMNKIKENVTLGYSIPYAISAKYNLHRTYAEFLKCKKDLKLKDINIILSKVSLNKSELFDETYIESLYNNYVAKL